jgi:hypothetical protein
LGSKTVKMVPLLAFEVHPVSDYVVRPPIPKETRLGRVFAPSKTETHERIAISFGSQRAQLTDEMRGRIESRIQDEQGRLEPLQLDLAPDLYKELACWARESDLRVAHLVRIVLYELKPLLMLSMPPGTYDLFRQKRSKIKGAKVQESWRDEKREFAAILDECVSSCLPLTQVYEPHKYNISIPHDLMLFLKWAALYHDTRPKDLVACLLMLVIPSRLA